MTRNFHFGAVAKLKYLPRGNVKELICPLYSSMNAFNKIDLLFTSCVTRLRKQDFGSQEMRWVTVESEVPKDSESTIPINISSSNYLLVGKVVAETREPEGSDRKKPCLFHTIVLHWPHTQERG